MLVTTVKIHWRATDQQDNSPVPSPDKTDKNLLLCQKIRGKHHSFSYLQSGTYVFRHIFCLFLVYKKMDFK